MIKQANEQDKSIIEDILLDAVSFLNKSCIPNQWNETNIKWDNLAKELTREKGVHSLRLDVNYYRDKLRAIYEKEGFRFVRAKIVGQNKKMALYEYSL